jgi:hypothetical protein
LTSFGRSSAPAGRLETRAAPMCCEWVVTTSVKGAPCLQLPHVSLPSLRGRYAGLCRAVQNGERPHDDPQFLAVRLALKDANVVAFIERLLSEEPHLSAELRSRRAAAGRRMTARPESAETFDSDSPTTGATFDELRAMANSNGLTLLKRLPPGGDPQYLLRTGTAGGELVETDLGVMATRIASALAPAEEATEVAAEETSEPVAVAVPAPVETSMSDTVQFPTHGFYTLVKSLSAEGLSQRAIASQTGKSLGSVNAIIKRIKADERVARYEDRAAQALSEPGTDLEPQDDVVMGEIVDETPDLTVDEARELTDRIRAALGARVSNTLAGVFG